MHAMTAADFSEKWSALPPRERRITGIRAAELPDPAAEAMPSNWIAAVDRFSRSQAMKDYLGARFVDIYSIVKRQEQDRYFGEVPALDYEWYLRTA